MIKTSWKKIPCYRRCPHRPVCFRCFCGRAGRYQTQHARACRHDPAPRRRRQLSRPSLPYGTRPSLGGPMHPGPQLTDEQVKEREARRAEWEKMTPEERQKAHEEKYSKWREERMKNMTPEEKERFEQREKQREEWRKMTPEERQKAREEARAKWDSMSDAEKDAAREHFRSYYHAGGGHYYEGHRKYRHHKGEYRGEHRGGYYGDGRTECPNSTAPGKYQKLT